MKKKVVLTNGGSLEKFAMNKTTVSKKDLDIFKSLNILCVDDEENIIVTYDAMFSIFFKKVYTAKNGEEGLEIFQNESIDIILTDHSMPVMTGLEMSRKIREIDPTVPIIMVTALESLELLRSAIDIRITSFVKKPISSKSIFSTLQFIAKSIVADRLLRKEQEEKLLYSSYQEKLTYQKETTIIKNDLQESKKFLDFRCEVLYKPRDILSGDSYIIRKISDSEYFMFLVDGMGKGISASVTAMLCSAYVNYQINHTIKNRHFSLKRVVENLLEFLAPNLLDEEVVSCTFVCFDGGSKSMEYATFSMPAMLLMREGNEGIEKIRSNNPPLAGYTASIQTSSVDISDLAKLLIYSDGLNENSIKHSDKTYTHALLSDFKEAESLETLEKRREEKVLVQEDDITYFFIKKER